MAKYVTIQVTKKEPPAGAAVEGEQCKKCSAALGEGELESSLQVCPHCGYHYPLPSHSRVAQIADEGSVSFLFDELRPTDPLGFFDLRPYPERLSEAQLETGLTDVTPPQDSSPGSMYTASYRQEWAEFLRFVRGHKMLELPTDQVALHRVIEACYASAEQGRDMQLGKTGSRG